MGKGRARQRRPPLPLGNRWSKSRCNTSEGSKNDTTPVDSYPQGASPHGALDMAGNVWEWVQDWYGSDYYQVSPQSNPTGPTSRQGSKLAPPRSPTLLGEPLRYSRRRARGGCCAAAPGTTIANARAAPGAARTTHIPRQPHRLPRGGRPRLRRVSTCALYPPAWALTGLTARPGLCIVSIELLAGYAR